MSRLRSSESIGSHSGRRADNGVYSRTRFGTRLASNASLAREYSAHVSSTNSATGITALTPDRLCPALRISRQRFGIFSRTSMPMSAQRRRDFLSLGAVP